MATSRFKRLIHPVYKALETRARVLRYLFVEITQRCNLACLHCGSDCGREERLKELSTDEWLRFFDYLPTRFDTRELALVVTGGEPLCRPELDTILAGLRKNRLHWGMVTNGWALNEANVERLIGHGLMSMTVSLDGMRENHDWLRGRAGSFDRAVDGIRRVARARLSAFDIVTCVNPRNLGELDALAELLRSTGVGAWRLFCIFPKGRAKKNADLLRLSDEQLRELFAWMKERKPQLAARGLAVNFSCEGYLPPGWEAAVRDEPYFCRAGINIASVLCDGAIAACPNITRSLVQGNLREGDFQEIWDGRFQPFYERAWMKTARCVGCDEWGRCQGNSLHLWDDEEKATALCYRRVLTSPLDL